MEIIFTQKDASCKTIEDVIQKNSGTSIKDVLQPNIFPNIPGIKEFVSMLHDIRARKQSVRVIGDYDADGITSTTIAFESLSEFFGYLVSVRFPRRFSEGYGMKMHMVQEASEDVLITVDNGIAAVDEIREAKRLGKTVIVIDHHLKREDGKIPDADLIIDSHITGGYKEYCAAGLMYRIALELCPNSPKIPHWTALAAVGTVADMMRLIGDNRRIVKEGLQIMNEKRAGTGLTMLLSAICGETIKEDDLGFGIGPVCNASGRLCDNGAEDVYDVLRTHLNLYDLSSQRQVLELRDKIMTLKKRNEERKELVSRDDTIVDRIIEHNGLTSQKAIVICLDGADDRQAGWVGILAGHIVETYHRVAVVFTRATGRSGIIKGSGRTYGKVHLKHTLDKCADLLLGFGGHEGAAGLTMEEKNLPAFSARINACINGNDVNTDSKVTKTMFYDLDINESDIPDALTNVLKYAPYGQGFPNIVFRTQFQLLPIKNEYYRPLGNRGSVKFQGKGFEAVGFHLLERYINIGCPKMLDVIFTLDENVFRGESTPQMRIEEMLPIERPVQKSAFADFLSQSLQSAQPSAGTVPAISTTSGIRHAVHATTPKPAIPTTSVQTTQATQNPAPPEKKAADKAKAPQDNSTFLAELMNLLKI